MSNFEWVAAFLLAIGATARLTRLLAFDHWPPVVWFRTKWDEVTNDGPWSFLVHCGYCAAPWFGLAVVGCAALSVHLTGSIHWIWWLGAGWLTVSYLGAILVAFDGDDSV